MKRRMSLERDFMDWHKDDIMYAYLLSMAEYSVDEDILYLEKMFYYDCIEDIMHAAGYSNKRSLYNNLQKWIGCGLIDDTEKEIKGKKVPTFIFKNKDDINKRYQIVELEMLVKLIDTKSHGGIQIYTYLLNKYKFKSNYRFTLDELKDSLGYSKKNKLANQRLTNILQDLKISGYIDYDVVYESKFMHGKVIQIPYRELKFVAQAPSELPTVE